MKLGDTKPGDIVKTKFGGGPEIIVFILDDLPDYLDVKDVDMPKMLILASEEENLVTEGNFYYKNSYVEGADIEVTKINIKVNPDMWQKAT